MCVQFIVVIYYDELITNKFYNKYAVIYVYSIKKNYKKHYNIIHTLHGQFTSKSCGNDRYNTFFPGLDCH